MLRPCRRPPPTPLPRVPVQLLSIPVCLPCVVIKSCEDRVCRAQIDAVERRVSKVTPSSPKSSHRGTQRDTALSGALSEVRKRESTGRFLQLIKSRPLIRCVLLLIQKCQKVLPNMRSASYRFAHVSFSFYFGREVHGIFIVPQNLDCMLWLFSASLR